MVLRIVVEPFLCSKYQIWDSDVQFVRSDVLAGTFLHCCTVLWSQYLRKLTFKNQYHKKITGCLKLDNHSNLRQPILTFAADVKLPLNDSVDKTNSYFVFLSMAETPVSKLFWAIVQRRLLFLMCCRTASHLSKPTPTTLPPASAIALPTPTVLPSLVPKIPRQPSESKNYRLCCFQNSAANQGPIYASGNGIRLNPLLVKLLEDIFKRSVIISDNKEEASVGAAKAAMLTIIHAQ
jgi:hypothetical protein